MCPFNLCSSHPLPPIFVSQTCDDTTCGRYGTCNPNTGLCQCREGVIGADCSTGGALCSTDADCGVTAFGAPTGTCSNVTRTCVCKTGYTCARCDTKGGRTAALQHPACGCREFMLHRAHASRPLSLLEPPALPLPTYRHVMQRRCWRWQVPVLQGLRTPHWGQRWHLHCPTKCRGGKVRLLRWIHMQELREGWWVKAGGCLLLWLGCTWLGSIAGCIVGSIVDLILRM